MLQDLTNHHLTNGVLRRPIVGNRLTHGLFAILSRAFIYPIFFFITACSIEQNSTDDSQPTGSRAIFAMPQALQPAELPANCLDSLEANIIIDDSAPIKMTINAQDGKASYTITEWPLGTHQFQIVFTCDFPQALLLASATITQDIIDGPNRVSFANNDYLPLPDSDGDTVSNLDELLTGTDPFNPPPDSTPPTAPGTPQAGVITPQSIELSWTPATDAESGVVSYKVYRDDVIVATVSTLSFQDTGLAELTAYSYQVAAINGEGLEGPKSAAVRLTTDASIDTTPPSAPNGLREITSTPQSIELTWNLATDAESGIASYTIYRDNIAVATVNAPPYIDAALTASTAYTYEVSATNGVTLVGPRSAAVILTTPAEPDITPPTAPGSPTANATTTQSIELTWTPASDAESGVVSYQIYRDNVQLVNVSAPPYVDTGLTASTDYSYQVSAINGVSIEGSRSAAAILTTLAEPDITPPTAPGTPQEGVITTQSIELTWTLASDVESGIVNYQIYRDNVAVATIVAPPYVDTGLTANTEYAYQVSAINGVALEGPRSATVTLTTLTEIDTTPPTAPGAPAASNITRQSIELTWAVASDAESGIVNYQVYRDGVVVATVNAPPYVDTGLIESTAYSYYVTAINGVTIEGPQSATSIITTLSDTTPPDLVSVATGAVPTEVTVVFNEAIDVTSATTISNYQISSGVTIINASLSADLITVTLTTSPLSVETQYILSVTNIMDLAIPANIIAPSSQPFGYLITGTSKANYQWDILGVESNVYTDETFTYDIVPAELIGLNYLRTTNSDRTAIADPFLSFTALHPVIVYIAYDVNSPLPSWVSTGWQDSGLSVTVDANNNAALFQLYTKSFPSGQVVLANDGDALLMYTIIVAPDTTVTPAQLSINSVNVGTLNTTGSSSIIIIGAP